MKPTSPVSSVPVFHPGLQITPSLHHLLFITPSGIHTHDYFLPQMSPFPRTPFFQVIVIFTFSLTSFSHGAASGLDVTMEGSHSLSHSLSQSWDTQMRFVTCMVPEHQLRLYGHVARFPDADPTDQILSAREPHEWRRPMGRPRASWLQQVDRHLKEMRMGQASA